MRQFIVVSCFLVVGQIQGQIETNRYEVAIEQLLETKNPAYYYGLKKVIAEYQKELVTIGITPDTTNSNIRLLLQQIALKGKMEYSINYDLKAQLKNLGEGIGSLVPSPERSAIAQAYFNEENSKDFVFNRK